VYIHIYYGIFAQSKNCGARETAVMTSIAGQQIPNKLEQKAAAREQLGKHNPMATETQQRNGVFYVVRAEML
jgi:hypothetical protein